MIGSVCEYFINAYNKFSTVYNWVFILISFVLMAKPFTLGSLEEKCNCQKINFNIRKTDFWLHGTGKG